MPEHAFATAVEEQLARPGTVGAGYNSIRFNSSMFAELPGNPLTRIADIDSDHLNATRNSIEEIIRGTTEVAAR